MTPGPIAHYRITGKLGEGGMGAVYRATDTKLNREVAIKVLPAALAGDSTRMARFEREAQLLASLNHPNIATIYGIEEGALIMELVEGADLYGPLSPDRVLDCARQIVAGLEAAHEKGIVHRDLKPANIKLTPAGQVKLLDFGLAKPAESSAAAPAGSNPTLSPTLSLAMTQDGMILGTAAYMSPEQARGQAVDKRADIWSFGVVLFELLTGKQLFAAPTVSDTLAAVLTREPDLSAVPERFHRLLRLCLMRDPHQRLRDLSGARLLLEDAAAEPVLGKTRRGAPWWTLALVAIVAAAGAFLLWRSNRPAPQPLRLLSIDLGPEATRGRLTNAVLSPDGSRIAYLTGAATVQLATRRLDQPNETVLAGTEGASDLFFSSDGDWLGFFADGKMKKVSLQGGAPIVLCDAVNPRGAWWDGEWIVAALTGQGLSRIRASGGIPQPVDDLSHSVDRTHRWPQILPGGESVLLTGASVTENGGSGAFDGARIAVLSLKTGMVKEIVRGGYFGRYLPNGWLTYIHQGTLFAAPFDPVKLETRGSFLPVVSDIAGDGMSGFGRLSFARDGTLTYLSGAGPDEPRPLVWLSADGEQEPVLGPFNVQTPRISPDGRRVAVSIGGVPAVYDIKRDSLARFHAENLLYPLWTPDGRRLVANLSQSAIAWMPADGSQAPATLYQAKAGFAIPSSISPDGKLLAFQQSGTRTSADIWVLPIEATADGLRAGEAREFVASPAPDVDAAFSPDGHWMAYASNDAGKDQVYVVPFPEGLKGGRTLVSGPTGRFPMWSRTRKELFYISDTGYITVVPYTVNGHTFTPETVSQWSSVQVFRSGRLPTADLAPDGKRFLTTPADAQTPVQLTMLLHFFDELQRKAK